MGGSFRLLEGFGNLLVFREPIRGSYSSGGVDIGTEYVPLGLISTRSGSQQSQDVGALK